MDKCEIVGCDELADYINDSDNKMCESCVEKEIEENDYIGWDDFEPI